MRSKRYWLISVWLCFISPCWGPSHARAQPQFMDLVILQDGRQLEGSIRQVGTKAILMQIKGRLQNIPVAQVKKCIYRAQRYLDYLRCQIKAQHYHQALKACNGMRSLAATADAQWRQVFSQLQQQIHQGLAQQGYDIVITRDGIQLAGKILAQDDQRLTLQMKLGKLHLAKTNIARVYYKETPWLAKAKQLLQQRQYEATLAVCQQIIKNTSSSSQWASTARHYMGLTYARLGDDHYAAGRWQAAGRCYQKALRYSPNDLILQSKLQKARNAQETARLRQYRQGRACQAKGVQYLRRKQYRLAYREFSRAINLAPDLPKIREQLDRCLDNMQVLYYGDFGRPLTLEPVTATKQVEKRLTQLSFEGLVTLDQEGRFIYCLANELEVSPDGMSYTFGLQKGVRWSNGSPLTARDVAFTLQLLLNPRTSNYNPNLAKYIADVTILDPTTLTITLARPFYQPLALLAFKILPCAVLTENYLDRRNPFVRHPVATGPFIYEKGFGTRLIHFSRNPCFRKKGKPRFVGVVFKQYQDHQSARNDLERGEIHLLTQLRPLDVDFFEKQREFTVRQYKSRCVYFLACNHRHALLRQRRFRLALLQAIDRQAILEQYFNAGNPLKRRGGQAHTVITGLFPANSWAYNDEVSPYPYDHFYAQQLLQELLPGLGYKRGRQGRRYWRHPQKGLLTLSLKFPKGDRNVEKACLHIAAAFKKLGIKVRLALKSEKDLYDEVVNQHSFDLVYTRYVFDNTLDVFPLFDSQRTGPGGTNFTGYVNPQMLQLFYRLHNSLNPTAIRTLAQQIHRIMHDDVAQLFLWQLDLYAAHANILRNVKIHPYLFFNFVEDWRIIRK